MWAFDTFTMSSTSLYTNISSPFSFSAMIAMINNSAFSMKNANIQENVYGGNQGHHAVILGSAWNCISIVFNNISCPSVFIQTTDRAALIGECFIISTINISNVFVNISFLSLNQTMNENTFGGVFGLANNLTANISSNVSVNFSVALTTQASIGGFAGATSGVTA